MKTALKQQPQQLYKLATELLESRFTSNCVSDEKTDGNVGKKKNCRNLLRGTTSPVIPGGGEPSAGSSIGGNYRETLLQPVITQLDMHVHGPVSRT